MAVNYHIYANGGSGGPVDYAHPVASTAAPGFVTGPLGPSSDTSFAVRAFDPATGLEEANTDARVRVVLDAAGNDVTGRPDPPSAVALRASPGGGVPGELGVGPAQGGAAPDGFRVYLGQGNAGPALVATVPYTAGGVGFACEVPGPLAFSTYSVAVKAFNASGPDAGAGVVTGTVGLPAETLQMDPVAVRVI